MAGKSLLHNRMSMNDMSMTHGYEVDELWGRLTFNFDDIEEWHDHRIFDTLETLRTLNNNFSLELSMLEVFMQSNDAKKRATYMDKRSMAMNESRRTIAERRDLVSDQSAGSNIHYGLPERIALANQAITLQEEKVDQTCNRLMNQLGWLRISVADFNVLLETARKDYNKLMYFIETEKAANGLDDDASKKKVQGKRPGPADEGAEDAPGNAKKDAVVPKKEAKFFRKLQFEKFLVDWIRSKNRQVEKLVWSQYMLNGKIVLVRKNMKVTESMGLFLTKEDMEMLECSHHQSLENLNERVDLIIYMKSQLNKLRGHLLQHKKHLRKLEHEIQLKSTEYNQRAKVIRSLDQLKVMISAELEKLRERAKEISDVKTKYVIPEVRDYINVASRERDLRRSTSTWELRCAHSERQLISAIDSFIKKYKQIFHRTPVLSPDTLALTTARGNNNKISLDSVKDTQVTPPRHLLSGGATPRRGPMTVKNLSLIQKMPMVTKTYGASLYERKVHKTPPIAMDRAPDLTKLETQSEVIRRDNKYLVNHFEAASLISFMTHIKNINDQVATQEPIPVTLAEVEEAQKTVSRARATIGHLNNGKTRGDADKHGPSQPHITTITDSQTLTSSTQNT